MTYSSDYWIEDAGCGEHINKPLYNTIVAEFDPVAKAHQTMKHLRSPALICGVWSIEQVSLHHIDPT